MRILITGAAGFIGQQLLADLAVQQPNWTLFAADIREIPANLLRGNVHPLLLDISRRAAVLKAVAECQPQAIVHLASVVSPPPGMSEASLHAIDVDGTQAVVDAAAAHGVEQLIITSSGAAYGYYPENAEWIDEHDPLRGHNKFAYARHKREVEELLVQARITHPQLRQLILRPGTILGKRVNNQITDMFKKPVVLGIQDSDSRFVFIWDQDVVRIIRKGLECGTAGTYNLAGNGRYGLRRIWAISRRLRAPSPAGLLQGALRLLKPLGLSQYGPEQVDFLRYRPVLANRRLKEEFGYTPRFTSREAFVAFLDAQGVVHA